MNTPSDGRLTSRIVATLALTLYSGAVAYGFVRVFVDGSFAGDLVVVVIVVHGLSLLLRRVHLAIALPLQVLVMVLLVCVLCHPDTLVDGPPDGRHVGGASATTSPSPARSSARRSRRSTTTMAGRRWR